MELKNSRGEIIQLAQEEAVISDFLAKKLGITKGEQVQIKPTGASEYLTFTISEIAYVSAPQGLFIAREVWENQGYHFSPTALLIGQQAEKLTAKDYAYVKQIHTLKQQRAEGQAGVETMQSMLFIVAIIAILLSWTVLYNLGTLNFTERYREYATMKVLGFTTRELRAIILRDNLFNYVVGCALGIPGGFLFLKFLSSQISTTTTAILALLSLSCLVIPAALLLLCTLATTIIISNKIKKINMIEALKSVE